MGRDWKGRSKALYPKNKRRRKNSKTCKFGGREWFYSPLEKTINETKFDKLPAKQWLAKFAKGEEAKWTGLQE